MCGIVGVVSKMFNGFSLKEADIFKDMLFVDTLRGVDSTGIFGVNQNNNVLIHKEATHGLNFIQTKEFADFRQKMLYDGSFVVGHNRAATRGAVTDANAHPFCVDDKIVLVQNGTYRGDHRHLKNTDVDTEALAHVLSEEDDITKALQKINAAYALVWYNTDTKKLHLIRNNERPLYLAYMKNGAVLFASEFATIAWAAHRNDLEFEKVPELLPKNTLVTFELDEKNDHKQQQEIIDCDYRYVQQGSPFQGYHQQQKYRWPGVDNDDMDADVHLALGYAPPALPGPKPVKPDDMQITISGQIMDHHPEYHLTPSDALEFESRLKKRIADKNTRISIELVDYFAGNKHDKCSSFIVFGKMLDPMLEDGPQPIFHWLLYGTTEQDVYHLVTDKPFHEVTLTSVNCNYFFPPHINQRKAVITCFVTNPQAIDISVNVKNVH